MPRTLLRGTRVADYTHQTSTYPPSTLQHLAHRGANASVWVGEESELSVARR